jgi:hypothetical protein
MPHGHTPHVERPHTPGFLAEFGTWLANMTWGARLRVLATGALLIWLVFVAFPITTVTTVSSAVGGLQLSNQSNNQPVQLVRSPSSNGSGPEKVAYVVATATPFPTKTPRPTATPKPKIVTAPVKRAAPAIVATATPAATPMPPLPPIYWDPRLGPNGTDPIAYPDLGGVHIVPAQVGHGQKFWRAISVKFEGLGESHMGHNVYVTLLDQNGKRAEGVKVNGVTNPEKGPDDLCNCQYVIDVYSGGAPDVSVNDVYPSDMVSGMCLCGIPNVMRGHAHVNFRIIFQLVTNP